MDLNTSSDGIIGFRSLFSLKQVCCVCFECICEAMLDSVNLPDKTLAKRFVLVFFQVIIQRVVCILLSVTNTQNRQIVVKTFRKIFFLVFAQR